MYREQFDREQDFSDLFVLAFQQPETNAWRLEDDSWVSQTMRQRLNLFRAEGRFVEENNGAVPKHLWVSAMIGSGIIAESRHPFVDGYEMGQIENRLNLYAQNVAAAVDQMVDHDTFLKNVHQSG